MRNILLVLIVCTASLFSKTLRSEEAAPKNNPDITTAVEIGDRYKALETFARGMFYLETLYYDPEKVKTDKMVSDALKGIVDHLDPHTMLMPKKAFEQLTIDTQGKFGGVGIIVSEERGKLVVVSPIEDTPAYRAGIKPGDEIIAIDGMQVSKMKEVDAVNMMRGDPDSKIKLTISRKGEKTLMDFDLIREVIKVKSVKGEKLGDGLYYARISSFQENTADELHDILEKNKSTMKGMILDLRDNPGGLLDQAVRVSGFFIDSGLIVSTVGRDPSRVEREFAHKRDTFMGFPMITLVNGGSASASEIVAGALQDHERSLIAGTTSFGKGSVQTLVSLPDGSGLKITVARYFTPKDRSIQAKGIEPDIVIPEKKYSEKDSKDDKGRPKKESDLDRHIESQDLSDISKNRRLMDDIKHWPEALQDDYQLITAFSYLKGWAIFQTPPTKDTPPPAKDSEKKGS